MDKIDYKKISKEIRKKILKMIFASNNSHIGSAFSCVDILTVLYFKIIRIDPKNPLNQNRDRFILSKGHAISALYATLAQKKFFSDKLLDSFCVNGSCLTGHSSKDSVPGVEVSTGSLGHGLAMGAGMAMVAKNENKNYRVFAILSDGECNEGSVWETAMFANRYQLDNLIAIIDYNKLQAFGNTEDVLKLEPLKDKWKSFGWEVKEVDGHNFKEMEKTMKTIPFKKNKPSVIIAHTVKGKGVSFMENKLEWHYKSPSEQQYNTALKELDQT